MLGAALGVTRELCCSGLRAWLSRRVSQQGAIDC